MADIFLSYASEHRDRVRFLVERLAGEGWSVWWDSEIHAGPRFDQVMEEEIDKALCVVVLLITERYRRFQRQLPRSE